jgi:hypothetical protein
MDEDPIVFKKQKKALKDIEPIKDMLSELSEDEPENIHDIKKRLTKK